mmetsp:Transcript_18989/g.46648  ORF Transcript_18989/g.46648 Transcript_18989/m.46648 type:complete len:239 (-) Transcript_18989:230-946(-)
MATPVPKKSTRAGIISKGYSNMPLLEKVIPKITQNRIPYTNTALMRNFSATSTRKARTMYAREASHQPHFIYPRAQKRPHAHSITIASTISVVARVHFPYTARPVSPSSSTMMKPSSRIGAFSVTCRHCHVVRKSIGMVELRSFVISQSPPHIDRAHLNVDDDKSSQFSKSFEPERVKLTGSWFTSPSADVTKYQPLAPCDAAHSEYSSVIDVPFCHTVSGSSAHPSKVTPTAWMWGE